MTTPSTGSTILSGDSHTGPYNTAQVRQPAPQYESNTGKTWILNEKTGEYENPDGTDLNPHFNKEKLTESGEQKKDSGGKRRRKSRRARKSRKRRTVKRKRKRRY